MSGVSTAVDKCRRILERQYGTRFRGLVLYGSSARGQSGSESDIDLLVLLNGPLDYSRELRRIVDLLYPVQLDSERPISAKPAEVDEFHRGSTQLYRNAQREGQLVT